MHYFLLTFGNSSGSWYSVFVVRMVPGRLLNWRHTLIRSILSVCPGAGRMHHLRQRPRTDRYTVIVPIVPVPCTKYHPRRRLSWHPLISSIVPVPFISHSRRVERQPIFNSIIRVPCNWTHPKWRLPWVSRQTLVSSIPVLRTMHSRWRFKMHPRCRLSRVCWLPYVSSTVHAPQILFLYTFHHGSRRRRVYELIFRLTYIKESTYMIIIHCLGVNIIFKIQRIVGCCFSVFSPAETISHVSAWVCPAHPNTN